MPDLSSFDSHEAYIEYYRQYRKKHRKKLRLYNRKYNSEWRKNHNYSTDRKYEKEYPERRIAHRIVQYAIKIGHLARLPCSICGKQYAEAHHEDYSKPLEVIFLCSQHHKLLHSLKKSQRMSRKR